MQPNALRTVLNILQEKFQQKDLLSVKDLIDVGIFESKKNFNWWRVKHPDFPVVKFSQRKLLIPKRSLAQWLMKQNEE